MPASVSYRLDPQLKARLAQRAHDEGVSETRLVTRLLDEGLKSSSHPGIVYRDGPAGRRAAVAGGPDVWEVVVALRHTRKRGDARVGATAEQLGIAEQAVRAAVSFAAAHPDEVEAMIKRNEARRARRAGGQGARAFSGLVRFLIDEMFSPAVARRLVGLGRDALHVRDVGLSGRTDDEVLDRATDEDRVVVTENAVDFVALLDAATSAGLVTAPVVLALKRTLPAGAGAMAHELVKRLARWADNHPDPYRHVHWLT